MVLCVYTQDEFANYHEMLSSDKEIVKSVLRLTGSVEGIKHQVRGTHTHTHTDRKPTTTPSCSSAASACVRVRALCLPHTCVHARLCMCTGQ